jgi:hypothetical protein
MEMAANDFYLIDLDGNTIWHGREKNDGPQSFGTFKDAERRAKTYAKSCPGEPVRIAQVVAVVSCGVSPPVTEKVFEKRR